SVAWTSRLGNYSWRGVGFVGVAVQSRTVASGLPVAVSQSARPFVTVSELMPRLFVLQRAFLPSWLVRRVDACQTKTLSQSVTVEAVAKDVASPSAASAGAPLRGGIEPVDLAPAAEPARQAARTARRSRPRLTRTG